MANVNIQLSVPPIGTYGWSHSSLIKDGDIVTFSDSPRWFRAVWDDDMKANLIIEQFAHQLILQSAEISWVRPEVTT